VKLSEAPMVQDPFCEVSREGSDARPGGQRRCPVCGSPVSHSARARYCSRACQQRAYRERRQPTPDLLLQDHIDELRKRRALVSQSVYECSACGTRLLGEWRCETCNRMCAKLGLGGRCGACEEIVLVSELLGLPG
jgi:hypothetical protein